MSSEKKQGVSRKDFLKTAAFVGGVPTLLSQCQRADEMTEKVMSGELSGEQFYDIANTENIIYTTCLNCNTGCHIKAKISDGVVVKIDGNPFSPWTMNPHIRYDHSPANKQIAKLDGAICPKGQAGIQTMYDPYRIRNVLKRDGKRGSGKWKSIPYDQAVKEVVNGGKLFSHLPGEESREVEGLKDICAMREPKLMKKMKADVDKIHNDEMTVSQFKQKYSEHLDKLIDPDHPDFGPKNNQLVFNYGRMKSGRSEFVKRFMHQAFGSVNRHGHTTTCQGSLYFACKAMNTQYIDGEWTGSKKAYWQVDLKNSEFVIFAGSNAFEGGYGPPLRTNKITNGLTEGRLKFAVVDPRMSKLAAKAWKWMPAKPGSEAALALALIQWIIDNKRYDETYLRAANKAAATAVNEPNWSNAPWLVKIDENGEPGDFLRAGDLPSNIRPSGESDRFIVIQNGRIRALNPNDTRNAVTGDLLVDTSVGGIRVKSSMQLLYESSKEHTIEGWAELCDIQSKLIEEVAREFTAHGKKAAADIHRGVSQHTNGYYNVAAWMSLNLLVGNFGWKGGMSYPSTYNVDGGKDGQPFDIKKMHPDKLSPFGTDIIRHGESYEKNTAFEGYPAKRPWYPLSSDVYQEVIPSIGDAYPYSVKALIFYMGAPNYALPAGDKLNEIMSDTKKLPLFIASDITIGATSAFADYIFPDGTYLERWEFQGTHPNCTQTVQGVRTPVITPLVDSCEVFGEEQYMSLESMLMAFAEGINLSGFGKNGFGDGKKFTHPDHFYLKMVANMASDGTPVPDASDEELELLEKTRKHIEPYVFDVNRWKDSVGEELWKKVAYVMTRGGRFMNYPDTYNGEQLTNAFNKQINMYCENTARTINSMTGEKFSGIPQHNPVQDSLGREVRDWEEGYDLQLSTYRQTTQTKSRTNVAYWLLAISPENYVLMNSMTARDKGLKSDDEVIIKSKTNPEGIWDLGEMGTKKVTGKIKVVEGLRPGTITFSLGFGQWGNGARDTIVDGDVIKGDERRGRGIHANAVMAVDPHLKNTAFSDIAGGSAVFYDTWVKVEKV
jgi:tetrathionate reductase subunit A